MNCDPFYKTPRWLRLREKVLRRDGYMCQLSKRFGKFQQAEVVHHIFPRDEFPEYQYEPWNLISLTVAMHHKLHDRTNGQLSVEGVKLLRKVARQQDIPVPLRYQ